MVDIHQIRLISLFRHFPDHFHFHPILEQKRVIDLIPCHMSLPISELQFGTYTISQLNLSNTAVHVMLNKTMLRILV